jgi:hypothetical protein
MKLFRSYSWQIKDHVLAVGYNFRRMMIGLEYNKNFAMIIFYIGPLWCSLGNYYPS